MYKPHKYPNFLKVLLTFDFESMHSRSVLSFDIESVHQTIANWQGRYRKFGIGISKSPLFFPPKKNGIMALPPKLYYRYQYWPHVKISHFCVCRQIINIVDIFTNIGNFSSKTNHFLYRNMQIVVFHRQIHVAKTADIIMQILTPWQYITHARLPNYS